MSRRWKLFSRRGAVQLAVAPMEIVISPVVGAELIVSEENVGRNLRSAQSLARATMIAPCPSVRIKPSVSKEYVANLPLSAPKTALMTRSAIFQPARALSGASMEPVKM